MTTWTQVEIRVTTVGALMAVPAIGGPITPVIIFAICTAWMVFMAAWRSSWSSWHATVRVIHLAHARIPGGSHERGHLAHRGQVPDHPLSLPSAAPLPLSSSSLYAPHGWCSWPRGDPRGTMRIMVTAMTTWTQVEIRVTTVGALMASRTDHTSDQAKRINWP
jgi:hypothetical protein